jgi:hypothetical protein
MTSESILSILTLTTIISMAAAFSFGVATHVLRRELDPIAMPFSAYLSGTSRRIGLACYSCLALGIAAFAMASVSRFGPDNGTDIASALFFASVVLVAIAAATARADAPLAIDDPKLRLLHRWSAFFAFLSVIAAIAVDTYAWRALSMSHGIWIGMAGLAGALVLLFAVLSFTPVAFKGAVQKLLMFGIVAWFVFVAGAMPY